MVKLSIDEVIASYLDGRCSLSEFEEKIDTVFPQATTIIRRGK